MKLSKNLFTGLTIFILGAGLMVASQVVKEQQEIRRGAMSGNASLSLPTERSVESGEEFSFPVMVNTDGQSVIAVDVVIDFDPEYLQLLEVNPNSQFGSLETYMPLDDSGSFKKDEVVTKANAGDSLSFGAAAFRWSTETVLSGFNGVLGPNNPLATLKFKALKAVPDTDIGFQFTEGETTDSNLVSGSQDILAEVTNCSLSVDSVKPTETPTPTDTPTTGCKPCPPGNPMGVEYLPKGTTDYQCNNNDHDAVDYTACLADFRKVFIQGESVEGYADYNCEQGVQGVDCTMALKKFREAVLN